MLELFSAPSNFDWITVAALAAPHFLYAFIWYMPHLWMRAFGKKSVNVFETTAWLLKGMLWNFVTIACVIPQQFPIIGAVLFRRRPVLHSGVLVPA
jgi:hypothetical protein